MIIERSLIKKDLTKLPNVFKVSVDHGGMVYFSKEANRSNYQFTDVI